MKQVVSLAWQSTRAAHHGLPTVLAEAVLCGRGPGSGRIVDVKFYVPRDKQIEASVAIVVAEGRTCGPAAQRDASLFRYISKCSIMIIAIEPILAVVRHVDVWPAIVVKISDSHAKSPALVGHAGAVGHIRERAIVIVVIQRGARRLLLSRQRVIRRAIDEINVGPAVVVIIENGYPRAGRLQNVFLFRCAGDVLKSSEP